MWQEIKFLWKEKKLLVHTRWIRIAGGGTNHLTGSTYCFVGKNINFLPMTRVGYSRGTRDPGSHEIFGLTRNFCSNSRCFGVNLTSRYISISCQMKEFFLSHTTCRKYFLVTGRNFLSEAEMSCHSKKFPGIRRNFLSQIEISWHQKKFLVTERNFLSQEGI